jgi:hypothetical protein
MCVFGAPKRDRIALAIVPLMPEGRGRELEENVATTS